ncbi:MAG: hypothetical protein WDO73_07230 [Ignavibacteriota bacterium]
MESTAKPEYPAEAEAIGQAGIVQGVLGGAAAVWCVELQGASSMIGNTAAISAVRILVQDRRSVVRHSDGSHAIQPKNGG